MGSRVGVRLSSVLAATLVVAGASMLATDTLAQARQRAFDPSLLENGDLIPYRALTRDDFRAQEPPGEVADMHGQLGAATCVFLTTHPDMFIRATSHGDDARLGRVRAHVHNLAFTVLMDRDCSWWNPGDTGLPAGYILEHEQIHFALFEIAARRLNQQAARIEDRMEAVSSSQEEAIEELRQLLDAELKAALDQVMLRSNDLDRQTSRAYRRERQRWWYRQVDEELNRLAPGAQQ